MSSTRLGNLAMIAATALALAAAVGCDKSPPAATPAEPWHFGSQKAPYELDIPGRWTSTDAGKLNRFADLAVSVDQRFYVIVIPQKLPHFDGVASPDAADLKRASLGLLKKRVHDLKVERVGPLSLGGHPGLSVFAEGRHNDVSVQYVNTYATHGRWGYQIIAWGPKQQQEALVAATDALLDGWSYTGADATTTPGPAADTSDGTAATDAKP